MCGNRIFVQDGVYDKFVEIYAKKIKELKLGNGMDPKTTQGPLINQKAMEKVRLLTCEYSLYSSLWRGRLQNK